MYLLLLLKMLSKDQMKMISGVSFCCGYSGGGQTVFGKYIYGGTTNSYDCQDFYDAVYDRDPSCDDIDCGCK